MAEIFVTVLSFSLIGFLLLSLVLALQLGLAHWGASRSSVYPLPKRHIDVPIIWIISWLMYLNLSNIIGSAIWHGPLWAVVWDGKIYCDIDSRLQLFASSGFICGATALARNLSLIISSKGPPLYFQTSKKAWIDLAICAIFPSIQLSLMYLVQPRRYAITQDFGCAIVMDVVWLSFVIYSIWIPIWSLIAAAYGAKGAYGCYRRKKDFSDILMCTGSGLTTLQFLRLMIFNFVIIGTMLPLSLYIVITRLVNTYITSYNFTATHMYFSQIMYVPYMSAGNYIDRWMYGTFAYVAFLIFGLGMEARMAYMRILDALRVGWIVRWFGASSKAIALKYLIPASTQERWAKRQADKMRIQVPAEYLNYGENDGSKDSASFVGKDGSSIQVRDVSRNGDRIGRSRDSNNSNSTDYINESQMSAYINYADEEAIIGLKHPSSGKISNHEIQYHYSGKSLSHPSPTSPISNMSISNKVLPEDVFNVNHAQHHLLQHSNHPHSKSAPLYSPDSVSTKFDIEQQQHAARSASQYNNLNRLGYSFTEDLSSEDIFGVGSAPAPGVSNVGLGGVSSDTTHACTGNSSNTIYIGDAALIRNNLVAGSGSGHSTDEYELDEVAKHRNQLHGFSATQGGANNTTIYYYADEESKYKGRPVDEGSSDEDDNKKKRESTTKVKPVPSRDSSEK